jgi:hypothetical protein
VRVDKEAWNRRSIFRKLVNTNNYMRKDNLWMDILKLSKGYHVANMTGISEGYEIQDNIILANVNADKQVEVIKHFIKVQEEPLFFILEIPTNESIELEIGNGLIEKLHKDIFYMDGCTKVEALTVLNRHSEILINDGLCKFGFASHKSGDELMVEKYGVVTIQSNQVVKYIDFYLEHEIKQTDNLKTAWDNFTDDNPGTAESYSTQDKTVYSIVEDLQSWGMYFAERRLDCNSSIV